MRVRTLSSAERERAATAVTTDPRVRRGGDGCQEAPSAVMGAPGKRAGALRWVYPETRALPWTGSVLTVSGSPCSPCRSQETKSSVRWPEDGLCFRAEGSPAGAPLHSGFQRRAIKGWFSSEVCSDSTDLKLTWEMTPPRPASPTVRLINTTMEKMSWGEDSTTEPTEGQHEGPVMPLC